jgi:hypothetical protein
MGTRRRIFAVIGVTTLTALAVGVIGVSGASAQVLPDHICHASGSQTNPYITNQPNNSGQLSGHLDHTGPLFTPGATDWGDIIPPVPGFPGLENGLNWPAGEATWANDCVFVAPVASPSPSPAVSPAVSPPAVNPPAVNPPAPGPGPAEAVPGQLAVTGPREAIPWLAGLAVLLAVTGVSLLAVAKRRP